MPGLKIGELERSIAGFVETCRLACAGGPGPSCAILEDLAKVEPIAAERLPR